MDIDNPRIHSGRFVVGRGEAYQRQQPGIEIEIDSESLLLNDWLALALSPSIKTAAGGNVKTIKMTTQKAVWNNSELGAFDLNFIQENSEWAGRIHSDFAKGKVKLSDFDQGSGKIKFNFDRLELSLIKMN